MFTAQAFGILADRGIQSLFLDGLVVTLKLFVCSALVGFSLGAVLAVVRMSSRVGALLVTGMVEYHRNVPSIVQILVWYFGIPQLFPKAWLPWTEHYLSGFFFAVVALSLNAAAYISEDLRSGFRAVAAGQYEASRALALSHLQALCLVLAPQAFRACLPALVSQALSLFKATALAMTIGVSEIMYVARRVDGETYATFAAFLVPSVMYILGTVGLMFSGEWLQRRYKAYPSETG
jgi:polar amino acid transport system permease protein